MTTTPPANGQSEPVMNLSAATGGYQAHSSLGQPAEKIIVIGAGPTGLGAAYRLKEVGHTDFELYDLHPYVGGLAHSFIDEAGFTWDIGGHVMFSHYTYYDQCFARLMGNEFTLNNRESWVRMFDRWVPYPFQNNIRYLPKEAAYECLSGLIRAQTGRGGIASPAVAANFGEFIDAVFGEGIARHFMRPYNFKVWAHPPEMMNKQWIGERVAILDIDRALKNVVLGLDDFGWGPNNQFKFPLRGGTGEFYARFEPILRDHLRLRHEVATIDIDQRVVRFTNRHEARYDTLISAMPLDVLCRAKLRGQVPDWVRAEASRLKHSSGYMVGLGIKARPGGQTDGTRGVGCTPSSKSWMYFPEENCPFYRATYLSNYSPHMTPDKDRYWSLLCETSESEHKPTVGDLGRNPGAMIEETIRGLENVGMLEPGERANIVSRWCYYADYSYPTPSVERDEVLARIIPWLESKGIYSRGRFGMWKYEVSNTDHTLMQGVELVNRLLFGQPETTIGMQYTVTTDGRNAAVHERSPDAGSGEKRLAPLIVKAKLGGHPAAPPLPPGDLDEAHVSEEELGVTQRRE